MAALQFHPGSHRDEHDSRDRRFVPKLGKLARRADLSRFCGKVYQQYRIQSCSANALASALTVIANQLEQPMSPPSRLFMYYNARALADAQRHDDSNRDQSPGTLRGLPRTAMAVSEREGYGTTVARLLP